ncbi:MAG TPA: MFS transporter [Streptomyces sp.]|nr:MFS transporter [Streptomyces sp.]
MGGVDRRFHALVSAYAISTYGNFLNLIALSLFSYQVTGTAFGVGAMMALRLCAGFVAGLAVGELSARRTRRTVMICSDAAQGITMTVMALCAARTPLWLLAGAVIVMGMGNTFFTASLRSAIPVIVGQEARARANGLLVTARSLATVLGFASSALVIGFGGFAAAFAVNAASFVVSGVTLLVLRPRTDEEESREDEQVPPDPGARRKTGEVRERSVWRSGAGVPALLLGMLLLRGVDALASSSHNVVLPVVAHATHPGEPAVLMTRFWAAWAVGTVLAHLVLRRSRGEGAWSERAFALGTCAMSLAFVTAFLGLPAPGLVLAAAAAGFADGWTEIVYTSRLQAAPDRQRSRLFGLSATVEQAGFAVGAVAAAAALEVLPAPVVVGTFHGAAMCGALFLLLCATGRRGAAGLRQSTEENEERDSYGRHTGAGTLPGA